MFLVLVLLEQEKSEVDSATYSTYLPTYLLLFMGQMLLDDLEAITGVLLLSDISCLMYIVGGYLDQ